MKIILPKINITLERWKYNSQYNIFVSTLGRFKNSKGELLTPKVGHKNGYMNVQTENGWCCCHRVVLETWQPRKDISNLTVDHKDHNKRNNSLKNLEWVSLEENLSRAENDLMELKEDINLGTPVIRCNGHEFYSFEQAINWLVDNKKISNYNKLMRKTIKKNIIKSIKQNKKYCNYIFELN